MTKQELLNKVSISWKGYGTFNVTIEFRGKRYSCTSHNTLAYDRIRSDDSIADIMHIAAEAKFPIPVVEDGKLLGIVSKASVIYLLSSYNNQL